MKHTEDNTETINYKVSVAMAAYNGAAHIAEQLESILNQTRRPDEIIICDDASKDDTTEVASAILKEDGISYCIIKHAENGGVLRGFTDATSACTGDVIFFCDQDDFWQPEKVESVMKVFEENPDCDLVFADASLTDDKLNKTGHTLWESIDFSPAGDINNEKLVTEMLRRNIFTGMSMAVKKELLERTNLSCPDMLHDEAIGWEALRSAKVLPLNRELVLYRQHAGNAVGAGKTRKFEGFSAMNSAVRASNTRTAGKFAFVKKMYKNRPGYAGIKRAGSFYKWRAGIVGGSKLKNFVIYLKCLTSGDYGKYTSKTDRAALKDLACIITSRKG